MAKEMKKYQIFKIPSTEEELTQKIVEELLEMENQLMYQKYLAPDLTDD